MDERSMAMRAARAWSARAFAPFLALAAAWGCSQDRSPPPTSGSAVHAAGFADPKAVAFHGKLLREARWAPMLDPKDPQACGRCHDGSPTRAEGVTFAAPGATPCTKCHSEPKGVLACTTCHDAHAQGAHAAHLDPSPSRASGLACSSCHPIPNVDDVISGLHANGAVEVIFDPALVAPEASWDRTTGACAVACHDRGGARAKPVWTEKKGGLQCGDCHASPPARHYAGSCTPCHHESDAKGTALAGGLLHLNGKVDLGNGSGKCGACHGVGDDPRPNTGAHASHATPSLAAPVACGACHAVPTEIHAPGHLDGLVTISFDPLARARSAQPTWDGRSCTNVACHGAQLIDAPRVTPVWTDTTGAARACGACHGIPPTQHTPSMACDRPTCHGGEIARDANGVPTITTSGRALHINGTIDVAQ